MDDIILINKYIELYYGVKYQDILFKNNNIYDFSKENILIKNPDKNILICL